MTIARMTRGDVADKLGERPCAGDFKQANGALPDWNTTAYSPSEMAAHGVKHLSIIWAWMRPEALGQVGMIEAASRMTEAANAAVRAAAWDTAEAAAEAADAAAEAAAETARAARAADAVAAANAAWAAARAAWAATRAADTADEEQAAQIAIIEAITAENGA